MQESEIKALLNAGEVTITFEKVDGTMRTMRCTTRGDLIPFDEDAIVGVTTPKVSKQSSAIRAFDLDKSGWRSFRVENLRIVDGVNIK